MLVGGVERSVETLQVDRIIKITGLDESVAIFDTTSDALAALAPESGRTARFCRE